MAKEPSLVRGFSSRKQSIQNLGSFPQRPIDDELSIRVQDLEHQVCNRHLAD